MEGDFTTAIVVYKSEFAHDVLVTTMGINRDSRSHSLFLEVFFNQTQTGTPSTTTHRLRASGLTNGSARDNLDYIIERVRLVG